MPAAGFRKALEQRLVGGIKVEHVAEDMPGTNLFQQFGEAPELTGQVACVDGHGHLRIQEFGMQQRAFCQLR